MLKDQWIKNKQMKILFEKLEKCRIIFNDNKYGKSFFAFHPSFKKCVIALITMKTRTNRKKFCKCNKDAYG